MTTENYPLPSKEVSTHQYLSGTFVPKILSHAVTGYDVAMYILCTWGPFAEFILSELIGRRSRHVINCNIYILAEHIR